MNAPETQLADSPHAEHTTDTSAEVAVVAESAQAMTAEGQQARGVVLARHKLSDEEEREVTRLYAESNTSVPEIARRFSIAESSVYRVAHRHGAPLRGRLPARAAPEQEVPTVSAAPEGRRSRPRGAVNRGIAHAAGRGTRPFRIRFEVEEVIDAVDVLDALRQAEARGITEITSLTRDG